MFASLSFTTPLYSFILCSTEKDSDTLPYKFYCATQCRRKKWCISTLPLYGNYNLIVTPLIAAKCVVVDCSQTLLEFNAD